MTEWEILYAYDHFMSGHPVDGIVGAIKHHTGNDYLPHEVHKAIVEYIECEYKRLKNLAQ